MPRFIPESQTKWKKDHQAINEAIRSLGLRWPVEIKITRHAGGRYGAHRLAPGSKLIHRITVKNWLTPEKAGRTIWHELTHARQAERSAEKRRYAGVYKMRQAWNDSPAHKGTYYNRPIEIEARAAEVKNADHPLALPR